MATNFVSLTIVKKKLLKFIHIYFAKIGFSFFSKVAIRVEMIFQKTFIEKNIKKMLTLSAKPIMGSVKSLMNTFSIINLPICMMFISSNLQL